MHTPRPRPRADGSAAWQVVYHYYDQTGARHQSSKTFDDRDAAQRWADLVDQAGADAALRVLALERGNRRKSVVTVTEWLCHYVDRMVGIEDGTRDIYHRYITRDIDPFMGSLPLTAISQDLDAAWIAHLQETGNSPKTVANKHGLLSAGLSAAATQRPAPLIPFNPCLGIRLPRNDAPEIDIFDVDEWELFEQLIPRRWQPEAEFALVSMARPGEIHALRVGDIDPATGAVRITKAWKGVGTKMRLGKPKSKRGIRTVNVPLDTLARLDLNRPRDELLFGTINGTPISVVYFYKKAWQPALRRLRALATGDLAPFSRQAQWKGADAQHLLDRYGQAITTLSAKRLTPYTLRHTGISWKLQDGVPLFVVSRDAGHESVTTTDSRYGHIDRRASEAAAQAIGRRLPRARRAAGLVAA
ncbi:tyrosine-type recombinase/integrase [Nocardia wallacei]|uniref:tyrosine-type recombinase/integrase n=1 Tax=Nocardia wallacei TaxID=480035 RepID=UPI002453D72D|nr:tyrosine-type recombinase/integrase [Nocardia wallacei]